jgi:protein gp37
MSDQRDGGIAWTDETWNPIRGCSRVSEGCRHCYAVRMAARFCGPGQPYEGLIRWPMDLLHEDASGPPRWNGVVRLVVEKLADPLRWRRPRRIFVNSMSDLFHEELTDWQIAAVFGVMAAAPWHTFQVLTKRPQRMKDWFTWVDVMAKRCERVFPDDSQGWRSQHIVTSRARHYGAPSSVQPSGDAWPLPNVWLGVSAENQAAADERIPLLLECPAAVRWVSAEPLLGPIDVNTVLLDWVVVGCESGPGARPMLLDWVRSIRDQCADADTKFFFKQAMEGDLDGKANVVGMTGREADASINAVVAQYADPAMMAKAVIQWACEHITLDPDRYCDEYVEGEWIFGRVQGEGEGEAGAVITYATEPSPETGDVGWCWWAMGEMGEAKDIKEAMAAAEAVMRQYLEMPR